MDIGVLLFGDTSPIGRFTLL